MAPPLSGWLLMYLLASTIRPESRGVKLMAIDYYRPLSRGGWRSGRGTVDFQVATCRSRRAESSLVYGEKGRTSLNCTMWGWMRLRWFRISRSTYLHALGSILLLWLLHMEELLLPQRRWGLEHCRRMKSVHTSCDACKMPPLAFAAGLMQPIQPQDYR